MMFRSVVLILSVIVGGSLQVEDLTANIRCAFPDTLAKFEYCIEKYVNFSSCCAHAFMTDCIERVAAKECGGLVRDTFSMLSKLDMLPIRENCDEEERVDVSCYIWYGVSYNPFIGVAIATSVFVILFMCCCHCFCFKWKQRKSIPYITMETPAKHMKS